MCGYLQMLVQEVKDAEWRAAIETFWDENDFISL